MFESLVKMIAKTSKEKKKQPDEVIQAMKHNISKLEWENTERTKLLNSPPKFQKGQRINTKDGMVIVTDVSYRVMTIFDLITAYAHLWWPLTTRTLSSEVAKASKRIGAATKTSWMYSIYYMKSQFNAKKTEEEMTELFLATEPPVQSHAQRAEYKMGTTKSNTVNAKFLKEGQIIVPRTPEVAMKYKDTVVQFKCVSTEPTSLTYQALLFSSQIQGYFYMPFEQLIEDFLVLEDDCVQLTGIMIENTQGGFTPIDLLQITDELIPKNRVAQRVIKYVQVHTIYDPKADYIKLRMKDVGGLLGYYHFTPSEIAKEFIFKSSKP